MIEMSGYITEEKIEIAKRHLIPKAKEENGLQDTPALKFNKAALEEIIEHYTRESGVRTLEKKINEILIFLLYVILHLVYLNLLYFHQLNKEYMDLMIYLDIIF